MKKIGIILFVFLFAQTMLAEPTKNENDKINQLISSIRSLKNAVFIRNGNEYNAKKAANHLKRKYQFKIDYIKDAAHFIEIIASKSSFSGRYYFIRFTDGNKVKVQKYLSDKLSEINKLQN